MQHRLGSAAAPALHPQHLLLGAAGLVLRRRRPGLFSRRRPDHRIHRGRHAGQHGAKLADGLFDAGYGDMNALVECGGRAAGRCARRRCSRCTTARPTRSRCRRTARCAGPQDLAGRKLVTHPNDAAWRMFPEFCAAYGIDPARSRSMCPRCRIVRSCPCFRRRVGRPVRLREHGRRTDASRQASIRCGRCAISNGSSTSRRCTAPR